MFATIRRRSGGNVLILDGGMGTTLEDVFHQDVSSALWSANPINTEPEVIIAAHLAFLKAGADIILTSTYQCAYSTFNRAGYNRPNARHTMRKAVHLAHEARRRYLVDAKHSGRDVKIVVSLGPFGATLTPTQEFDGFYPPPYGPYAYDPLRPKIDQPNAFGNINDNNKAIEVLTEFHAERLRVFMEDEETWSKIDGIAFETIPLTREIRAVRRAMSVIQHESESENQKPWWISVLYPAGSFPEKSVFGSHINIESVVKAMLDGHDTRPDGIGINCTGVIHLRHLLKITTLEISNRSDLAKTPALVLYPNGGDVWNPETRRWQQVADGAEKAKFWAREIVKMVRELESEGVWPQILVGGCCRTGPAEIAALAQNLRSP